MGYIDVHTHSGCKTGICVQNIFAQEIPENFVPLNYCSIGFHPWHIKQNDFTQVLKKLNRFARHPLVLGIGECGLDKNIAVPLPVQEEIFRAQTELAEEAGKPVIVHCVKAYTEILRIRKNHRWNMPWLFHWFHSSYQVAMDLIELNCYLSFGRSLLKPDGKNAEVFARIPVERVFLETDDAEFPIEEIYRKAAVIKGLTLEQLQKQLEKNFRIFFGQEI